MTGRPSLYSEALATAICERLAEGESLRKICRDPEMPGKQTVMRWLASNEMFRDQYARAREAQADHYAEEIIDISDDGARDSYVDADGVERVDHDVVARARLRVDARKWYASKLAPKKYGDKVTQELIGKDGGPIQTENVSEIEVARRLAFALEKGARALKKDEIA